VKDDKGMKELAKALIEYFKSLKEKK